MVRVFNNQDYDHVRDVLSDELLSGYLSIIEDKDVIVKPNLAFTVSLACTRWEIVYPIVSYLDKHANSWAIVESNVFGNVTPQEVARSVGYPSWAIDKIINITEYPDVIEDKVLINVPKLKTHDLHFKYTCARKNLLGFINTPEDRFNIHRGDIDGFINGINNLNPSSLVVVDAIEVMEGKGSPIHGKSKYLGYVIIGNDAFEVDRWVENAFISTGILDVHHNRFTEWLIKQAARYRLTSTIYSKLIKVREEWGRTN